MIKSRFIFSDKDVDTAKALSGALKLPEQIALLLVRQGIRTPEQAQVFFNPGFGDLHDPFLMKGMSDAVSRIKDAVESNQKISVFCDYDVDGTSSCSMLLLYLRSVGADIDYYLPDRNSDGYGMNIPAANEMADKGTQLVITVDCGITNIDEVALLKERGVNVIITDHHECGEKLPEADVILNPKQLDCDYPYPYLSGAGIVFKLLQALCGVDCMAYVDYAALGTVADIVPLTGENRIIAKLGLKKMNENIAPGIGMICPYVLPDGKPIDEFHIGFGFGPRINAAGRMDTAHLAMDVLSANQETTKAKQAAGKLNALNDARKDMCDGIVTQAMAQVIEQNMLSDVGAIFVIGDWEPGVVGICASKLTQQFGRPVLVFAKKDDEAVCSARSIDEINIYDVLSQFSAYYLKFGGHHMAAGLTIKTSDFEALRDKVNAYLKKQFREEIFVPKVSYDIEVKSDINTVFADTVTKLAPFGQDNPKPKLLFRNRTIKEKTYFGRQAKAHMKFNISNSGKPLQAVKFFFDSKDDTVKRADIIGSINISDYTGNPEIFIDYFEATTLSSEEQPPAFALENTLTRVTQDMDIKEAVPFKDVVAYIKNLTDRSPFGALLMVEDSCQHQLLEGSDAINEMLSDGRLIVKLANEYNVPLNAVGYSASLGLVIKPYREIITLNPQPINQIPHKSVRSFAVEELLSLYRETKKTFSVNREDVGNVYRWIKAMAEQKQSDQSVDAMYRLMAKETNLKVEQAAAGVRILTELNLIELDKSDMIKGKLITHQEKKDLGESRVFQSLQSR